MGIFSWAIAPIEGIIHDLETPVEEVTRLFGVVITAVKDIIQDLISLISQIEKLFDANKFAKLFVQPFNGALATAINGVETVASLIFKYNQEGFDDFTGELEQPIKDAYNLIHVGITGLCNEYTKLVNEMHPGPSRLIDDSSRELYATINKIDNGIALIKDDITRVFRVIRAEGTSIVGNFTGFANNAASTVATDVNRVGQIAVDDLRDFHQQTENRMRNENAAIDSFFLIIAGAIFISLLSVIVMLRSTTLLIAVIVIVVLTFLSYYIV